MQNLTCIIADDEPIARQLIASYIKEIPSLTVIAECKNAFEVLDILQKQSVDLLFLDINMPKLSGLSLLKSLQQTPEVIITTAYPEYAIEGFELSVTDYLLKPFSLERFIQAVLKVHKNKSTLGNSQQSTTVPVLPDLKETIFIKSNKKLIRLEIDSIVYIEAYGNYIKVHADIMYLVSETLTVFLTKLPETLFIRIHKSYAVNFNKLQLIDGNQFVLQNQIKLPIGKSYRSEVLARIDIL